jgi:putative nucleotidyltransferase with HDIG domain
MEFVTIRTATLRGDQKLSFDVYLEINHKHITYIRKGDSIESARLQKLKDKNLKKMFIRVDDEENYRKYIMQNIDLALDKSKPLDTRSEIIQGIQQSNAEAVMEEPQNEANYNQAKEGAGKYVEFLMREEKAVQTILNMKNENSDMAHHGVSVATLGVAIANKVGLKDPAKVQLLVLGSLLHDFGHIVKPPLKPLQGLEGKDRIDYMKHALDGAEAVRRYRHFDAAVISIIIQHEELVNGSGFPNKLLEKATDPLAVIVSTANDYDRLIMTEKLARPDAIKKFTIERMGLHPLEHFQALKSI